MKKLMILLVLLMVVAGCATISEMINGEELEEVVEQPKLVDTTPSDITISMKGAIFDRPDVTLKQGGTVTWVNDDDKPYIFTIYTETEDKLGKTIQKISSGKIEPGKEFSHTFEIIGKHKIIPLWHGSLRGVVNVVE